MASTIEKQDRFTTSSIETFFDSILRGKLSKNIYYGALPNSLSKDMKDMVVVSVGSMVRDRDAYATGSVNIMLCARPNSYGVKNVKTLQTLEKKLNELTIQCSHEHYTISRRASYSGYDGTNDIFYNVVNFNLIIS